METENVYSAVLSLFKTQSWENSWRIVLESRVRIILEKRDFVVETIFDSERVEKRGKKRGPGRPRRSPKADDGVDARSVKRRGPGRPRKNAANDKVVDEVCAKRRGQDSKNRKTRRRQDVGDTPTPDEIVAFDSAAPEANAVPETGCTTVKAEVDEIKSEYKDSDWGDSGGDFGDVGVDFGDGGGDCDDVGDDWGGSFENCHLNPERDVFALDLDGDLNCLDGDDDNDHVTNHITNNDEDDNYEDKDVHYGDDDAPLDEEDNSDIQTLKDDSHAPQDLTASKFSTTSKRIPINSDLIDAATVPSTPVVETVVDQSPSLQPVDRSTCASNSNVTVSEETPIKGTLSPSPSAICRKSRKLGKYQKLALPRGSYSKSNGERDSPRQFVKKPCPVCKKTTYGNKYLRIHIKRCHLDFMSEKEKEEAAAREVEERTCNICSKTLSTKGALGTHMKEIHLRDSLEDRTCNICGKELSTRRRREEHIATQHDVDRVGGPYPCELCSKIFGTKEKVRHHLRFTCPQNQNAVECPICGRKYRHEEGIRYHLLTEHADAGYLPESDSDHKLLNLKATCYICGKEMKRFSLKQHIAFVHQGMERVIKCKQCDLTFSSDALLRKHKRQVHPETQSQKACQKCDKSFTSYQGLKNHVRGVHMGIRNQCGICPSSFFSKKDLKEHMNSVHMGNKHQCHLCPRDFNRRSELNRHKRNVHNIDTNAETAPDS